MSESHHYFVPTDTIPDEFLEPSPHVEVPSDLAGHEALMEFDRKTCRVFKRFRRAITPFDLPAGAAPPPGKWLVLVTEMGAGVRVRTLVSDSR